MMKTMTTQKKLLSLTALTAVLGASFVGVQNASGAASDNIQVNAEFKTALELSNVVDMDYGIIGVSGTPAGTDLVRMNTNDSIENTGGTSAFSPPSTGTAGEIEVTAGSAGDAVNVFCSDDATLFNTADDSSIDATDVRFDFDASGNGTAGQGANDCQGSSTGDPIAGTIGVYGTDAQLMLFSAVLDGSTATTPLKNEAHSTSNGSGTPIEVTVSY